MIAATLTPQTFDFGSNPVRVIDRDGAPWFVAADVCRVLEIANHRDATESLEEDEKGGVGIADAMGRDQVTNCVSESGLYALIFKSRKPQAKSFRKWVTAEVLPQIRRQGFYMNTALDYAKYPVAEKFADLYNWLRSMEITADAAADVARSLVIRETPPARGHHTVRSFERVFDISDVLEVMGSETWRVGELQMAVTDATGMSKATFYRVLRSGRHEGHIRKAGSCRVAATGRDLK